MHRSLTLAVLVAFGACTESSSPVVPASEASMNASPVLSAVDLGTLGGNYSSASAVNSRGQVAGTATTTSGFARAFLWQSGRMQDLGTLGGLFSSATAINEVGQVAGGSRNADGEPHAFFWDGTLMHDLGKLPGANGSLARGVNRDGWVVGYSYGGTLTPFLAFVWQGGVMSQLPLLPGGSYNVATSINDKGQIAGYGNSAEGDRVIIWENGAATALPPFPGSAGCWGTDLNEYGDVVGSCASPVPDRRNISVIWRNGVPSQLDDLIAVESAPRDINRFGQVSGWARMADGSNKALYWTADGTVVDLGTLGGSYGFAEGMNDRSQVAGTSTLASGARRATLWQTVPGRR